MQTVPADFILFIVMICRMLQAFEFKPKIDLCMFALTVEDIAAFPPYPLCSVTGREHFLLEPRPAATATSQKCHIATVLCLCYDTVMLL